jgi:chemotaxis protein CheD
MQTVDTMSRRIPVLQGECRVSEDPGTVLTTVLGSCVAACLRDPMAGIGGMNHFLLPSNEKGTGLGESERYGVHLMELLVNELMRFGARRDRLEAKLFGGSRVIKHISDIGKLNADFALQFVRREGIRLVASSLGGAYARRLHFYPVSGRARQMLLPADEATPALEMNVRPSGGDVELF